MNYEAAGTEQISAISRNAANATKVFEPEKGYDDVPTNSGFNP